MSEEKKLDEKTGATALDDTVLEAVSGGEKSLSLDYWADQAAADVAAWASLHVDNDTEQRP